MNAAVLRAAYARCTEGDMQGTEVLQLVQQHGHTRARLVPATQNAWKITYEQDFEKALAMVCDASE